MNPVTRRALALALATVLLTASGALAGNGVATCTHGVQPFVFNGVDWNEATGYRGWIVGWTKGSDRVPEGTCWAPHNAWITNSEYSAPLRAALADDGYTFAGETPMEDYLAKLQAVSYVIDEGSANEQTIFFRHPQQIDLVLTRDVLALGDADPMQLLYPRLPTPAVGKHTVHVYLLMSADHNDGLDLQASDYLRAGWNLGRTWTFRVVPG